MNAQQELVAEFHRAFGHPVEAKPVWPAQEMIDLRIRLIVEELGELETAVFARDLIEIADALGDLAYVVHGMGLAFGLVMQCAFMEIKAAPHFPERTVAKSTFKSVRDGVRRVQAAVRRREAYSLKCALEDLLVAIYSMADVCGIPIVAVIEEVHRSNMSKLGADGKPIQREDGKILKGPNFTRPDLARVMRLVSVDNQ